MKKTLLVTIDFPPNVGGVATYYANIGKELPPQDLVVLAPKQKETEEFDEAQKYKIIRETLISKNPLLWPRWWPMIKAIKRVVEQEKIEVILVGQILPVGTVALYFKQTKKIPYYIFCHGMDITQLAGRKKTLAKKIIVRSAGVFANSNFTKQEAVKLGAAKDKVIVVYPCPNPLAEASSVTIDETKLQYNLEGKKVLLTVGRLVKRKGHNKVIEALPAVLEKFPNTVYVIAGAGPEEDNLKTLARSKRVADKVIFTGKVTDEKLAALLEICNIFIMPSRQLPSGDVEGFGIVYLEANLAGKPVIAGQSGGVAEAVIDNYTGLIVNPENSAKISEAIIKLLSDEPFAYRLGLQGQHRVIEKFNWDNQVANIERVL